MIIWKYIYLATYATIWFSKDLKNHKSNLFEKNDLNSPWTKKLLVVCRKEARTSMVVIAFFRRNGRRVFLPICVPDCFEDIASSDQAKYTLRRLFLSFVLIEKKIRFKF